MQAALKAKAEVIDVHHAGTAMRFLTAYFAHLEGREVMLTGSQRMQERPIKILVEALRSIGASIAYEKKEGYPPIIIKGKKLTGGTVTLPADISSQYISALLLIGPILEHGIQLDLVGKITSVPYINMTLSLLNNIGVQTEFKRQSIRVEPQKKPRLKTQIVESDWSSASYYFSIVALSGESEIHLTSYKQNSLQGDRVLREIYSKLGVSSSIEGQTLILKKEKVDLADVLEWDLSKTPDIAQTIAVSCYGLGVGCKLRGLHTLKIKETDRLQALYNELTKLGAQVKVTHESLELEAGSNFVADLSLPTYNDHRMAMAFAPLALKVPLTIENAEVVSKSYPTFWKDLEQINFNINYR
jgi:3-phosphoshikimate 1-carboxyvinyltransferase